MRFIVENKHGEFKQFIAESLADMQKAFRDGEQITPVLNGETLKGAMKRVMIEASKRED